MDENVLGLSGCSDENALQREREKAEQGCHASRWEQSLFTSCLPGTGEKDIHFSTGFVPFSLVYAPPADLIMSMPPETPYNKFSPLQWHFWWKQVELTRGVAADSWNWLQLLCHPELYRSGFATLKGEDGSTLREGAGLGPSPLGEKAGLGWS